MAGLPVAKLNSFGKVRVGFTTTCTIGCFKLAPQAGILIGTTKLLQLTGGFTGRLCLIMG